MNNTKKISEYIAARICVLMLCVGFIITMIPFFTYSHFKITGKFGDFTKRVLSADLISALEKYSGDDIFDWKKDYPFAEDEKVALEKEENKSLLKSKAESVKHLTQTLSNFTDNNQLFRLQLVNFACMIDDVFSWNLQVGYNATIKLKNGYWTGYIKKADVTDNITVTNEFNDWLKTHGMKLYYVQSPYKLDSRDYQSGLYDFSNQNADEFLEGITKLDIPTLDLRKNMQNSDCDFYSFFYKTDHHWTVEAALWACEIFTDWFSKESGMNIDSKIYDKTLYNSKLYKNAYLGSQGRKVTLARTKPDDFTLITPNFPTSFNAEFYNERGLIAKTSGDFSALLDMTQEPSEKTNFYKDSAYRMYFYGNCVAQVENMQIDNDYKILLVADSFANPFEAFLSLSVKKLDRMDLRHFNGSLKSYIEKNGPYDAVIMSYTPNTYGNIEYNTHTNLFDFR